MLEKLKFKVQNIYFNEVLSNINPTPQDIKTLLNGRKHKTLYLVDLLEEYSREKFKLQANSARLKTHQRYTALVQTTLTHFNQRKLRINKCDNYLLDQMAHHIIDGEGYSVAYTKKAFAFIKTAMQFAFNRRYIDRIPGSDYKIPHTAKSEVVYLDEPEVDKIFNYQFSDTLQRYADMFMIQCYTGLSYVDLRNLNAGHLIKDKDGLVWINLTRQKVETAECLIPVIEKVWELMKKYNFDLPVFSNQKYNAALKSIARETGIRKKLTTHVGRKTYGTLLLNKDVPIETVSRLLGHSSIRTTQKHYAKVLHMKIARDVRLMF